MDDDLASLFAERQTNEIDWGGPLYNVYELPTDSSELTIRFVAATPRPPQGLRLKIRGGIFEIDTTAADDVVLWEDTAPEEVRVRIRWTRRGSRSLRIWNAWRVGGVTQAWLGNAGMRVAKDDDESLVLRCSDGEGEPDFDNLVAGVAIT